MDELNQQRRINAGPFDQERFFPEAETVAFVDTTRRTAKVYSGKKLKVDYYLRFTSIENLEDYLLKTIAQRVQILKDRREQSERMAQYALLPNPFKVGDVFYDSWGYDQTNIDFYQVVETTARTVTLREIASRVEHRSGYSDMSHFVTPDPDVFLNDKTIRHTVQWCDCGEDKPPTGRIASKHGSCQLYDGTAKYESWYA